RLAALAGGLDRERLGARAQERLGALQDLDAAGGGQPRVAVAEQRVRGGERVLDDGVIGGLDLTYHAAIEGRVHRERRGGGGDSWEVHVHRYSPDPGRAGTLRVTP